MGSSAALTLDVPNSRVRVTIPTLTLGSNTTLRVYDSGNTTDTGRISAAAVNSLVGSGVTLNKIGNRTLELPGDNSATFTGGAINVASGAVRVRNNGSLGSAFTAVTIERGAVLEIAVSNFTPSNTSITQRPGSIERWNVGDARGSSGTYNLAAGVNLQLNTSVPAGLTVGLAGGTIEGFLHIDHPASAAFRTFDANVVLSANSFVGQNVLLGQNYDLGRTPTVFQPFANTFTGTTIQINGNITGAFDLTKTGLDTVLLNGAATV
jgi:hypothetical protein